MNRLGIAVRDLGSTELNWRLLTAVNRLPQWDITLFFEDPLPPCLPVKAAAMRLSEAWGYTGPVVATTLSTARRLALCPRPSAKLFYCWDLEWVRMPLKPFHALRAVYADPRLRVVARTDEHATLLRNLWGADVKGVIPTANLAALVEVCNG